MLDPGMLRERCISAGPLMEPVLIDELVVLGTEPKDALFGDRSARSVLNVFADANRAEELTPTVERPRADCCNKSWLALSFAY
jgi:hypothetical protein